MMGLAMDERSGVERLRARQKRRRMIGVAALLLIVADVILLWALGGVPRNFENMPPDLANGIATGMLVGAAISFPLVRKVCKQHDEHDVRARMFGAQIAFTTLMIAYPAWAMFAIGRWLPPVNGVALWIAAFALFFGAFAWRKYR